jgi:outer membrane protein TolC
VSAVPWRRFGLAPVAGAALRPPLARALTLAGLLFGFGPGCGLLGIGPLVGPDYETPEAPVETSWIDFRDTRIQSEDTDLRSWWRVFGDPVLDDLMEQAGAGSLTLQAAAERVSAARARRDLAVGFMFPQAQGRERQSAARRATAS